MTVKIATRFRERMEPPPPLYKVVAGRLLKKKFSDNSIATTTVKTVDCVASPSKIERTWDTKNPGPPFYSGGPFQKVTIDFPQFDIQGSGTYRSNQSYTDLNPGYYLEYQGGFTNPEFTSDINSIGSYLSAGVDFGAKNLVPAYDSYCSQVYAKLRPQIEQAGIGVALAELRDLPRMLKTTSNGFHIIWGSLGGSPGAFNSRNPLLASMRPKSVADHYLNIQFGWVPFLKDLSDLDRVLSNSRMYMERVERNNNTWVRRVRTIDHQESVTRITGGAYSGCEPIVDPFLARLVTNNYGTGRAHYTLDEEVFTRVWAAGQFKFYRPEFDRSLPSSNTAWGEMQRLRTLLGARITPSVVYKATPWTWLADWFSNVGNTVQRLSDAGEDQVASRYMYLMHHKLRRLVLRSTIHFHSGDVTMTWSRNIDVKQRGEAPSPYNFCLDWSHLTPKQLTILAALGITRK